MSKLSDRVRANSEAAPWVVDEIKRLEAELTEIKERLTRGKAERGMCEVPPDAGYPWFGCGECDTTFGCYEGEARCIRLLPLTAQEPVAKLHDETIGEIAQIAGLIDAGETGQAYDICKGLAEYHHQEAASIRRKEGK